MKKYTNYFLVFVFALVSFSNIYTTSVKDLLVATLFGFCTLGQAAHTARVKIKPYAYFGTDSGLVAQDLYMVPASFAPVCCKNGALKKNPDCAQEAARIKKAFGSELVSACCANKTPQEQSNCFEFKKS